jgi:hypothetical protein
MLLHLPTWSKATVLKVSGEVEVEVALGERGWREEDQRTPGYVTVAITCDRKAVIKVRVCVTVAVTYRRHYRNHLRAHMRDPDHLRRQGRFARVRRRRKVLRLKGR